MEDEDGDEDGDEDKEEEELDGAEYCTSLREGMAWCRA
jgi:hypothetical protein